MKSISFFSIKTQFENAGDALINREMIDLARSFGEVVVDVSRSPSNFTQMLRVNSVEGVSTTGNFSKFLLQIIAARIMGRRIFYFTTPGGMTGEVSRKVYVKALAGIMVLLSFRIFGVQTVSTGCSFESLGQRHLKLVRMRRKVLTYLAPRDSRSFAYLAEKGIKADYLIPDLAFNIYDQKFHSEFTDKSGVAFSLRSDQFDGQRDFLKKKVLSVVSRLPVDQEIYFVSQVGRDSSFLREMAEVVSGTHSNVKVRDVSSSIEDCISSYRKCRVVFSNRLHALLLAGSVGCDLVPWAEKNANQKIIGIFNDIGVVGEPLIEIDSLDVVYRGGSFKAAGFRSRRVLQEKWQKIFSIRTA